MPDPRRAIVLVLGDLGRSPRIVNQAISLAAHGWSVDLVGYGGTALPDAVRQQPRIRVHLVSDLGASGARPASRARFVMQAASRGLALGLQLVRLLLVRLDRPDVVLVQNPPGIPTLPLAWLACRVRSSAFVIDWHNLTSAMLELRVGAGHPLVRIAAAAERICGRHADGNVFVTEAMATRLRNDWRVDGSVFRDRPPAAFQRLDGEARVAARREVLAAAGIEGDPGDWLIVLSPTSWTADEDFDLLLDAARRIETETPEPHTPTRRILVVATGRGALRERFEHAASKLRGTRIRLATAWFDAATYPAMIAAADAGLCLHRSTSGLDLPAKIMDFFGAGVPVCALDYGPCLFEAVQPGVNGITFLDAPELAKQLQRLSRDPALLQTLRAGATIAGALRWDDAWPREVLPMLAPRSR